MGLKTTIRLKHQKQQKGKATSFQHLDEEFVQEVVAGSQKLTRRRILCLVMSQFDPLGLISPLMVRAKVMLRDLYGKGKDQDWDTPIKEDQALLWGQLIQEAQHVPPIQFRRQLTPRGGQDPHLVVFWDGSLLAHGTCLYLRWLMEDGSYDTRLVTGKCRVAPLAGATVQRMELQGLTVASRLAPKVVDALPFMVKEVSFIGDSLCCIMALRRDGVSYNPYFQHRLAEITANLEVIQQQVEVLHPVKWVESMLNPADMLTKPYAKPDDLREESVWQAGPSFLALHMSQWPAVSTTVLNLHIDP